MKEPASPVAALWQGPVTGDTPGALTILHRVSGEVDKFIILLTSRNTSWVGRIVVGTHFVKVPFCTCRNREFHSALVRLQILF